MSYRQSGNEGNIIRQTRQYKSDQCMPTATSDAGENDTSTGELQRIRTGPGFFSSGTSATCKVLIGLILRSSVNCESRRCHKHTCNWDVGGVKLKSKWSE